VNARGVAEYIAERSDRPSRSDGQGGFLVTCPAHDDSRPSLHVSAGKRQAVLVHCLAGCATAVVLTCAGLRWSDVCGGRVGNAWAGQTEEYLYTDRGGGHLFTVCRAGHGPGKRFSCYRFADDGQVVREARTMPRALYHLPEVVAAARAGKEVYLCEGEKDADAMRAAYGVVATTNPFGATVWAKDAGRCGYAEQLRGAAVVVVQHEDTTGRQRTQQILASLAGLEAAVRVVRPAAGNDAYDHIDAGHGLEEFLPLSAAETALADDGRFAALPNVCFEGAAACNLTHLDYRVLFEVAHHSVRREQNQTVWLAIPCPSSWLAKCCGGASASAVRGSLARLRDAGLLLKENANASSTPPGAPLTLRVNEHYEAWRPLSRAQSSNRSGVSPASTAPDSSKDTSTREDLGLREGRNGGS
jgi:hypothetical protein